MGARVNRERFYDRFIPRRTCVDVEVLNYMLLKDNTTSSAESETLNDETRRFTNKAYVRWQRKLFQERLWSHRPIPKKMLTFSQTWKEPKKSNPLSTLWPVRARTQPLIGPPTLVLDMPSLEGDVCQQTTDWSSTGYLASVFAGEVFLWSPQKNDPKMVTNTGGTVGKCIRWNKHGTAFAMAYEVKGLAIFGSAENSIVHEGLCNCNLTCCITAMEWTTSNLLITGCSLGRMVVWDEQLKYVTSRFFAHDGSIVGIRLSCDEKYLSTSGGDNNVRIWFWPQLREHFQVSYMAPVRGIAWHPWNGSLLAIGGGVGQGCLSIWNASSVQQKGRKSPTENNAVAVDNLAWNPLTGELVVSYWKKGPSTSNGSVQRSSIVVLSNLTTEVDEIEWHAGRVLYLLWGDEGATLATAGTDENLCMWDFFGNAPDTLKKLKKKRKSSSTGHCMIETAKIFGQCIR